MKKRLIIFIIILIALSGVLYFLYINRSQKDDVIRTSGIIDGIEVNLSPKVAGRISEICCREGDIVQAGQVVIRLDSEDLRAAVKQAAAAVERAKADVHVAETAIENAKAQIQSSEAEIKSVEADAEAAQVRMEDAKKDLERAESLYAEEIMSKELYDKRSAGYDSAVAGLKSAKARVDAFHSKRDAALAQLNTSISQLNSAKARVKELESNHSFNKAKLNDTVIISPLSGAVIFKGLETGETVSPGITILTIVDLNNLYVRIDLEETLIGFVGMNSEAFIRVESIPGKVLKGRISEIGRYAEFATQRDVMRGRQDIKTFRIKIRLDDHEGLLKPGMTVLVEIPKKA